LRLGNHKEKGDILWSFAAFLRNPSTPEDLARINEHISQELPPIKEERESNYVKVANFVAVIK
jgi:hypothetical protein